MKNLKLKLKKTLIIIIIIATLMIQVAPVRAIEIPTAPETPVAPITLEAPVAQETPTAPVAPETPVAPTVEEVINQNNTTPGSDGTISAPAENDSTPIDISGDNFQTNMPTVPAGDSNNNNINNETTAPSGPVEALSGGNVGNTTINTGDALNGTTVLTNVNNNVTASSNNNPSAAILNSNNGSGSLNNGSVAIIGDNNTIANNNANIGNDVTQNTVTGQNNSSLNVGDTFIQSGNANTTGTIISAANTNVDGIAVSEFNVVNDHTGDLVLDLAANCIVGCSAFGATSAQNIGNGATSDNSATIDQTLNNNTLQDNTGVIGNTLALSSDSGNNQTNLNTGGDNTIKTGDANVDANVLSFLNNNLAGNVVLGVVNVFGKLIGDIILPQSSIDSIASATDTTASNIGNGAASTNTADINQNVNDTTFQTNNGTIENVLTYSATTGNNSASRNTDGDSIIKTGSASVDANTLNVANSNVDGGDWWLVVVNKAGEWVGKILGAPEGSNLAGSQGTEFKIGENGEVTAINNANGADSNNTSTINQDVNNTTVQTNDGTIVNNIDLSANTGFNQANNNTGGNNFIQTGDAKVIANLVNFVNNNVSKGGKLVVTVVNVFGTWMGDFVTPGTTKEKPLAENPQETNDDNSLQNPTTGNSEDNNSNSSSNNNTTASAAQPSNVNGAVVQKTVVKNIPSKVNALVAGISTTVDDTVNKTPKINFSKAKLPAKEKIELNLAWLLAAAPFATMLGAVEIIRRRKKIHEK